ncbi:hypothetical protein GLOIN_2v1766798 [Rhizophagus irregularis DAOM 181602=DAOM 197198]|nr:hypothetical protein GLOIN_2v1766798 [Rhizophagus irregularis DAOM 181602=DAOM 197198]
MFVTNTEANHQTILDASQIETPKKTKIARLDLFRDRDIDEIIIGTNKTTKRSSQAINESSTISFYIPSVVISPPSSIKTMISDKATSGGKAASGKAASGKASGKAASGKIASGKASGKAASGSSKLPSSSVKAVISKESPSDNNVTTSSSKVTDQD